MRFYQRIKRGNAANAVCIAEALRFIGAYGHRAYRMHISVGRLRTDRDIRNLLALDRHCSGIHEAVYTVAAYRCQKICSRFGSRENGAAVFVAVYVRYYSYAAVDINPRESRAFNRRCRRLECRAVCVEIAVHCRAAADSDGKIPAGADFIWNTYERIIIRPS